jgi:hypothetical protein
MQQSILLSPVAERQPGGAVQGKSKIPLDHRPQQTSYRVQRQVAITRTGVGTQITLQRGYRLHN